MAFFSEVKAKLGMDITSFERGISKAGKGIEGLKKKAGSDLMNRLAPAALIAGFVSILRKAQDARDAAEEIGGSLSPAVAATAQMADNLDKAKEFALDLATRGISAFQSGVENITAGIIAMLDPSLTKDQILGQLAADKEMESRARMAAKQKEKDDKDQAERDKKGIASIADNFKKSREESNKRAFDQLSTEDKIRAKAAQIAKLKEIYADETQTAVKRSEALLELEKSITEYGELKKKKREEDRDIAEKAAKEQDDANKKAEDAQKKKTDELKKQTDELKRQRDQVKQTLADYAAAQRKNVLPSSDDVRSGKRNIGSGARRQLSDLDRAKQDEQRAADRAQRAFDRRNNAGSSGEREAQEKERQAAVRDLQNARGRRAKLEGGLEGRVADIETPKASLKELEAINKGIAALNTKLEPKSI